MSQDILQAMQGRPWVQTAFGGRVHIPGPGETVPEHEIRMPDIAYQLAGQTRFNGSLILRYSVAQHSVWVADAVYAETKDARAALYGLLHDGHEAYISDMVSPLKWSMPPAAKEWWQGLEAAFDRAIFAVAGLAYPMPAATARQVKAADYGALCGEAVAGMRGGPRPDWRAAVEMPPESKSSVTLEEMPQCAAAQGFLELYAALQDRLGRKL